MEKIVWEKNVPQTLALQYPAGRSVISQKTGNQQFLFSTVDGRLMYLDPTEADKIHALQLRAREPFRMCKREVRYGAGKARIEWQVERIEGKQPVSRPAAPSAAPNRQNGSTHTQNTPPIKVPMDQAIERYLLAAGRATREAERVLGAEGGSVRFDSRDVAAIAASMFIHASREGWLCADAPAAVLPPATAKEARETAVRAQQQVAERRIETLQAERKAVQAAARFTKVNAPWPTKVEQDRVLAALREAVGEVVWADALARIGVRTPSEIRYWNDKEAFINAMVDIANGNTEPRQQEVA